MIATRVGGLPTAVQDDVDGILCDPEPASVAAAIERMATEHARLAAGVRARATEHSFDRYCALVDEAIASHAR